MDTLSPELKEALMKLPGSFHDHRKVFNDFREESNTRFKKIEESLDEATFVNFENGEGVKMKVANILPKMHTDLKEIKQTTEFLRDFSKLHSLNKKYKIYHLFTIILSMFLGVTLWDILVEFVRTFAK